MDSNSEGNRILKYCTSRYITVNAISESDQLIILRRHGSQLLSSICIYIVQYSTLKLQESISVLSSSDLEQKRCFHADT
jgi:hypothetical protein